MRRPFSKPVVRQIIARATNARGEIACEGCGLVLAGKPYEIDHILAEELIPDWKKDKPLTAQEGQLLGRDCCHRPAEGGKTRADVKRIAKSKRQLDKHTGAAQPTHPLRSRNDLARGSKRKQNPMPMPARRVIYVEKQSLTYPVVPTEWTSGEPISEEDREKMLHLRKAGCECELPLLGERPGKGPRCRLCNVEADAMSRRRRDMFGGGEER